MVGDARKIEQELAAIEEKVTTIAEEFRDLYAKYLEQLGQVTQRQLILASYEICTRNYPESFIKLPYSQREKLQQDLQNLGKKFQGQLLECLDISVEEEELEALESQLDAFAIAREMLEQHDNVQPFPGHEIFLAEDSELDSEEDSEEEEELPSNPEELVDWHRAVEGAIARRIEAISKEANSLLQQVGILPNKIPPQLLDIAMQAEETAELGVGKPNLLNLLVETEEKDHEEDNTPSPRPPAQVARIVAIRLRLPEIEFADTPLSMTRKQIRDFLSKISSIRKQYIQKRREKTIAEAEAAWRSSWYENNEQ